MKGIEEINKKLRESFVTDLSKPVISKFERAMVLEKYMKENELTPKQMCGLFNFKKGTLSGWMKWGKLGETKYKKLKEQGMSESDITNMLKGENSTVEGQFLMLIKTITHFIDRNSIKIDEELKEELRILRNKMQTLIYRNGDRE